MSLSGKQSSLSNDTSAKPHQQKQWVIPPAQDAAFVAAMENILDLYQQPLDPRFPVVNMDEQPVQLLHERRVPIPGCPGRVERVDYEYRRNGTDYWCVCVSFSVGWVCV